MAVMHNECFSKTYIQLKEISLFLNSYIRPFSIDKYIVYYHFSLNILFVEIYLTESNLKVTVNKSILNIFINFVFNATKTIYFQIQYYINI